MHDRCACGAHLPVILPEQLDTNMHDLATINRLNLQAFGQAISRYRARGTHVVTQHEGAHLVGFKTFDDASAARDAIAMHGAPVAGARYQLLEPFAPDSAEAALIRGRDQSEDYAR